MPPGSTLGTVVTSYDMTSATGTASAMTLGSKLNTYLDLAATGMTVDWEKDRSLL